MPPDLSRKTVSETGDLRPPALTDSRLRRKSGMTSEDVCSDDKKLRRTRL